MKTEKTIMIECAQEDTIYFLKELIHWKNDAINLTKVQLVFCGNELKDTFRVANYPIQDGSVLEVCPIPSNS
jgi:hypothetical protein